MSSSTALLFLVLFSLLPSTVVCLTCYKCVYPSILPLECHKVPVTCAAGQRCLYSTSTASTGSARTVLKKKRCAMPSECGVTGKEYVAGLYFSHTSHCCDTNLCNAAARPSAPCWSLTALSLSSMALAVMLNPI